MALEGLDRLDNMSRKDLRKHAKESLDAYIENRGVDHHALLIDAQFYLRELQSRDERRSRRFDILLELVIIAMIGWEIYEGRQQGRILQDVQESSTVTARTLRALQGTMETMNGAIQSENEQANRVLIDATYSGDVLMVTNTGHPTLIIHAVRAGAVPVPPLIAPRSVSTGERLQLQTPVERAIQTALDTRQRYSMPLSWTLRTAVGTSTLRPRDSSGLIRAAEAAEFQ
jgi:hypothetical protein